MILLVLAMAQDHAPPILAPVAMEQAVIPTGPPRTVRTDDVDVLAALPAGSTVTLVPGVYPGPLHLDRAVTLHGEGATIEGGSTVLAITADDVTVTGLAVRGGGADATRGDAGVLVLGDRVRLERIEVSDVLTGIDLRNADDGAVIGCHVTGRADRALGRRGDGLRVWESDRNQIVGNSLDGVRDLVIWYSEGNTLTENRVTASRYGAHFMHAENSIVRGNHFEGNVVGVFVMYSGGLVLTDNLVAGANGAAGMGLGFKESDDVTATGNRLYGNTTGIYLDGTPHRIGGLAAFRDNTLAYNHAGLRLHGGQTGAEFRGNRFHENTTQVTVDGRADATGTVFERNTWTDYTGYDLDRDGVGDLPYAPRTVTGSLAERRPALAFFANTPAAGLLQLLAEAFPMFAPRPVLVDALPVLG